MPKYRPLTLPRDSRRMKRARVSRGSVQPWVIRRARARLRKAGGDAFLVRLLAEVFGARDSSYAPGPGRFRAACDALGQRPDMAPVAIARMADHALIQHAASADTFLLAPIGRALVDDYLLALRGSEDTIAAEDWVEGA